MNISAVILANTKSSLTRMLAGKPLISWVKDSLTEAGAGDQLYIISPEHKDIRQIVGEGVAFSFYDESDHSSIILQAANFIESRSGITIVMPANLPLLGSDVLRASLVEFIERAYDAMILTTVSDQANGLERILRDTRGIFLGSKAEYDLPPAQGLREINSGVYFFNTARLLSAIGKLGKNNSTNGDVSPILGILLNEGRAVGTREVLPEAILPIESIIDSNLAAHILNGRNISRYVEQGVEFIDAEQTFVEASVEIGPGTVIWPGSVLTGDTKIGKKAVIGANSVIESSQIGDKTVVKQAVISNSFVGKRCEIGPYAHLHEGAWLERDIKVGSGADISNAIIGHGAVIDPKVLIKDADIGDGVRMGAGAVTVNEDARGKSYRTTIGPLAMIGSNASLVAPVDIEANSYIAAGSVITGHVPEFALAVGRSRQTNIEDWVRRGVAKSEPV